jgi:hypothetical protein
VAFPQILSNKTKEKTLIIKNYPQFAKKTFLMAVDRKYFVLFVLIQTPIYFLFLFVFSALASMLIVGVCYMISVVAYAKDNYLLEKFIINFSLKVKYMLAR